MPGNDTEQEEVKKEEPKKEEPKKEEPKKEEPKKTEPVKQTEQEEEKKEDEVENSQVRTNQQLMSALKKLLYGEPEDSDKKEEQQEKDFDFSFYYFFFGKDKKMEGGKLGNEQKDDWFIGSKHVNPSEKDNKEKDAQQNGDMQLDDDMVKAAKEGNLFVVSDQPPYLQQINVDANGKVSLETVKENPLKKQENEELKNNKEWKSMSETFDNLVAGNRANEHWQPRKWWDNNKGKNAAKAIIETLDEHKKKEQEAIEEKKKLAEQQKAEEEQRKKEEQEQQKQRDFEIAKNLEEEEKKKEEERKEQEQKDQELAEKLAEKEKEEKEKEDREEKKKEEEKKDQEEKKKEEEKKDQEEKKKEEEKKDQEEKKKEEEKKDQEEKKDPEKKEDQKEEKENPQENKEEPEKTKQEKIATEFDKAVEEPKKETSPTTIAQGLQQLSNEFDKSKYLDDNAIRSGMEIKREIDTLKTDQNKELLETVKKDTNFKENQNIYEGKACLAQLGDKGKKAKEEISNQEDQKTVDKNLVSDVMVAELASNLVIQMNGDNQKAKEKFEHIKANPDPEKISNAAKKQIENTDEFQKMTEKPKAELDKQLGNDMNCQRAFSNITREIREKEKKKREKEEELKKQKDLEKQKKEEKKKGRQLEPDDPTRRRAKSVGGMGRT